MLKNIRSREAAMPFIMIAVLIDMAAIGVIVPVLPTLVASFATDQANRRFVMAWSLLPLAWPILWPRRFWGLCPTVTGAGR